MSALAAPTPRPIRPSGKLHRLQSQLNLPCPLERVFPFFADARNLEQITPPFLKFEVLTPAPIDMREGTRIDYRLRVHHLPIRWQSEIIAWDPPHRFVDLQVLGPYRWWHHTHRFEPIEGGTRVVDEVEYAVPGGPIIWKLFVKRDVERIFAFRQQRLSELFAVGA